MVTTLTGENSFALRQALDDITDSFISQYGDLAVEKLDGQEASAEQIQESLVSLPFLVSKKLVTVRSASSNKQFIDQAEQLINNLPETTELVLVEPKLDKRISYYKLLKKQTNFREFLRLDEASLSQWLCDRAKADGASLKIGDARYLIERVGNDQQLLANELEKLILRGPIIDRALIDELTDKAMQSTVFELLEAAFAGNSRRTLQLYDEQRSLKVEVQQLTAMLTWQLHVLAVVKVSGERSIDKIAAEAKINPFVVRKSQAIARNHTVAEIKKLINDLLKTDLVSKRTNTDPDEALKYYLLTISSSV